VRIRGRSSSGRILLTRYGSLPQLPLHSGTGSLARSFPEFHSSVSQVRPGSRSQARIITVTIVMCLRHERSSELELGASLGGALIENAHKMVARPGVAQKRLPTVTAEGDEVQIATTVIPPQGIALRRQTRTLANQRVRHQLLAHDYSLISFTDGILSSFMLKENPRALKACVTRPALLAHVGFAHYAMDCLLPEMGGRRTGEH
jgi:hypothetical protein